MPPRMTGRGRHGLILLETAAAAGATAVGPVIGPAIGPTAAPRLGPAAPTAARTVPGAARVASAAMVAWLAASHAVSAPIATNQRGAPSGKSSTALLACASASAYSPRQKRASAAR